LLAEFFGALQRDVRIAQNVFGPAVAIAARRNPDTRARGHLTFGEHKGNVEGSQRSPRNLAGRCRVFDIIEQDNELVAAKPGEHIAVAEIADIMPKAVVDDQT
jgi:hypothetical protein